MKNGKTTLADGTLAGSNITLLEALQNCVSFGIPLTEAVEAATLRPAVSVGVDGEVGSIEPGKRGGKPCIRGLRITVYDVLDYLASGMTETEILADFPYLTTEDIRACLAFAADRERHMMAVAA